MLLHYHFYFLDEQPPPALTTSKIDIITLEKEFDKQAKEASRLQQELNTARDNIHKTGLVISDSLKNSITGRPQPTVSQSNLSEPSKLQANTNNNNLNSFHENNEISVLTNTKIHLENALEDSQVRKYVVIFFHWNISNIHNIFISYFRQKIVFIFIIDLRQNLLLHL